jgi:hypothetical protein
MEMGEDEMLLIDGGGWLHDLVIGVVAASIIGAAILSAPAVLLIGAGAALVHVITDC